MRTKGAQRTAPRSPRRVAGGVVLAVLVLAACASPARVRTGVGIPRLPPGWRTVTYRDVAVDVPGTWAVRPWHESCGVRVPTVFVGPAKPATADCVVLAGDASEVILGGLQFGPTGRPRIEMLNGWKAVVTTSGALFHGPLGAGSTYAAVTLPTLGVSISVYAGESARIPGGAPGRAEQIVTTVHATTRIPAHACAADAAWPSITLADRLPRTTLTVPTGTVFVVEVPGSGFGRATDVGISDSRVVREQCSEPRTGHGRKTVLLALGPGRSDLEATVSSSGNGEMPAWLGTVVVTAPADR